MAHYEFTYPSLLESEGQMLKDLVSVLDKHRVQVLARHSIMVMICEAFNNALLHGNQLDPAKKIKMVLTINRKELCADIIDEGSKGLQRINRRKPGGKWAESGRGIGIIGHYADSVRFEETEKGGLKVTMKFTHDEKTVINKR